MSNLPFVAKYMVHVWCQSEAGVSWNKMRLELYSYLNPIPSYHRKHSIAAQRQG